MLLSALVHLSCLVSADMVMILLFHLQKLEFTLVDEPRSPDAKSMSIEKIQEELDRLIVNQNANNEKIFDWIEVIATFCYKNIPSL